MLRLQESGSHNINLVTPEHVVPQIIEALAIAIDRGLTLPIVYNTSAYDALSSLKLMDGLVDIYMPDFKFWFRETAKRLAKAKDYPEHARAAIREMHRQVGDLRFTADGIACRGLLVRHLVMPDQLEETRQIFHWLAAELSPDTYVNIMGQYRPDYQVGRVGETGRNAGSVRYAEINRCPARLELEAAYEAAVAYAKERKQLGTELARLQAIQCMIADMATDIDAARLLTYRAAWLMQQAGKSAVKEPSMAKLFATEAAHRVCHKAVQIFGGYGYTKDFIAHQALDV